MSVSTVFRSATLRIPLLNNKVREVGADQISGEPRVVSGTDVNRKRIAVETSPHFVNFTMLTRYLPTNIATTTTTTMTRKELNCWNLKEVIRTCTVRRRSYATRK